MLALILHQARKRVIGQLLLDKGALALSIGMGGVIVLLLAGTQILNWYWPVLLAAASLGVGAWQLREHIPSLYTLAQRIDRKLGLADALSTAIHFSTHPKPGSEAVCEVQRRSAESVAATVDLKHALPYTRSRYLAPAAGLFLVAAGLFAVRYAVVGSLDLAPSLIEMAVDTFFASPPVEEAKRGTLPNLRPQSFDPSQPGMPSIDETTEIPLEEASELKSGEAKDEAQAEGQQDGKEKDSEAPGKEEDGGKAEDKQGDKSGDPKQGDQDSEQDGQEDNRSMLDKLRDAMANLMNQVKSDNNKQNAKQQKGEKQKGKNADKGQKGEKGDEQAERADGQPQSDAQEGEQGDEQKDGQPGESQGQKQEDAAAGAGKQDGKKDIEQAKMLEAMGKLSEILAQRSEGITGQVMIEVGKTKQQLRTQFSNQQAGHAEAGSEIHRDQIPLMDQTFVERYFQEIRK